jgi:hypothetical protein
MNVWFQWNHSELRNQKNLNIVLKKSSQAESLILLQPEVERSCTSGKKQNTKQALYRSSLKEQEVESN